MKERPILFSTPMVQAVLDGRKIMTRRIVSMEKITKLGRGQFTHEGTGAIAYFEQFAEVGPWRARAGHYNVWSPLFHCPYGKVGEQLWIRETFYAFGEYRYTGKLTKTGAKEVEFVDRTQNTQSWYRYVADGEEMPTVTDRFALGWHCRPSIFMPRVACRQSLEITGVRVERLQEITEDDAIAEGVQPNDGDCGFGCECCELPTTIFERLWDGLNAKRGFGWDVNPWVWVIEFNQV